MSVLELVHVQWAADGRWSEAVRLAPGKPSASPIFPPKLAAAKDLAFELFFAGPDGPSCYLGFRHVGAAEARARFMDDTARIAKQASRAGALDLVDELYSISPDVIFGNASTLELGVVDLWREFGPLPLSPKIRPGAELDAALASRPDLLGPRRHWLALEWLADAPMPCWMGTRVSEDEGPLSSTALEAALRHGLPLLEN